MQLIMRNRILTLVLAIVLLAPIACATSSTAVHVGEPQPVGASQRPIYNDGDVRRVVVISAVPAELEQLLDKSTIESTAWIAGRLHHVGRLEGHPVVLLLTGVSMVNAAAATQAVIDHFDVGGIVFSGIAGGVNPSLAIGDVAVPAQWGQHQEMVFARQTDEGWDNEGRGGEFENFGMMFPRGQLIDGGGPEAQEQRRQFWFPVDERMLAVAREVAAEITLERCVPSGECLEHQPRIVVGGNGVSGSTFVNNAEFREWVWRAFEADALDMETAAIGQIAALNNVPFLGFRSLSDLAGGGAGANEIRLFGRLAAGNSAAVLLEFLREWRGPR